MRSSKSILQRRAQTCVYFFLIKGLSEELANSLSVLEKQALRMGYDMDPTKQGIFLNYLSGLRVIAIIWKNDRLMKVKLFAYQ